MAGVHLAAAVFRVLVLFMPTEMHKIAPDLKDEFT